MTLKNKICCVIIGVMSIIAGIKIFITGYDGQYMIPVPPSTGILYVALGIFLIICGILAKIKQIDDNKFVICTRCKEKYKAQHVSILLCPKCNGKLEPYEDKVNNSP